MFVKAPEKIYLSYGAHVVACQWVESICASDKQ